MQKCRIGNLFVNTLLIADFKDEKLKTYFPDIPIIKPDEMNQYFESLPDKHSGAQCKKTAELLDLNLKIEKNLKQLREEKISNKNHDRKDKRIKQTGK